MNQYQAPGVYVEEISSITPLLATRETATPDFIGFTEKHMDGQGKDLLTTPHKIQSFDEFKSCYGTDTPQLVHIILEQRVSNSSNQVIDSSVSMKNQTLPEYLLFYSIQVYFANGGGPCYIYSVGQTPGILDPTIFIQSLKVIETLKEATIIVFPDVCKYPLEKFGDIIDAALFHCNTVMNRFVIIDVPGAIVGDMDTIKGINVDFRDKIIADSKSLRNGAAYYPYLETNIPYHTIDSQVTIERHIIKSVRDDGTESLEVGPYEGVQLDDDMIKVQDRTMYNLIQSVVQDQGIVLPPSGAVAGAYVRNDVDHGVWKAPANISLTAIKKPSVAIPDQFQESLNVDPTSGKSINAIRHFSGKGILIWGARTLAGNDNEWRYVPVRRFYNVVEASVQEGTAWVVFEPNDANTWGKVKSIIENFLLDYWRKGALVGSKPEDAFFVNVGLGETMTTADIQQGRIRIQIGLAVVRPAEFVIIRITHLLVSERLTIIQRLFNSLKAFIGRIF